MAQQQFLHHQTRFNSFAEADIIGNQEIDSRKPQGFSQWKKLIGVLVDPGPERGLEQVPIGGGRGIPPERAQIGREYARVVGSKLCDAGPALVLQHRSVEFCIPQDIDHLTLSVIVHA